MLPITGCLVVRHVLNYNSFIWFNVAVNGVYMPHPECNHGKPSSRATLFTSCSWIDYSLLAYSLKRRKEENNIKHDKHTSAQCNIIQLERSCFTEKALETKHSGANSILPHANRYGHLFLCDSKVQTALQNSCRLSSFSLILLTQFTELFPFFTFSNFSETMSFSLRLNCLCCVLHSECNHGKRTLRTQRSTSCLLIDYWAKLAASRCENNAGECISLGQYYILSETRERA